MGFNNIGSVQVLKNIKKYKPKFDGVLGISIGKSKNTKTKNAWQDYLHLMDYFYLEADYLAVNISSPICLVVFFIIAVDKTKKKITVAKTNFFKICLHNFQFQYNF